jgi:hypothetical protein
MALYVIQGGGGADNLGMVFQLTPPALPGGAWAMTVIYTFTGSNGEYPFGPPIFDTAGNLYTQYTATGLGGAVFQLAPPAVPGQPWTLNPIYLFTGTASGTDANSLLFGPDGNLYGSTMGGGINANICSEYFGCGTVFSLSPPAEAGAPWSYTDLYDFTGLSDGSFPAILAIDANGILYGSADYSSGVNLFQLAPNGENSRETTIQQLDNSDIKALVADSSGSLFAADLYTLPINYEYQLYNGMVIELSPKLAPGSSYWTQTTIYDLGLYGDGALPSPNLAFDSAGAIYGSTSEGGAYGPCFYVFFTGCGTVFQLTPPTAAGQPWTENILYRFSGLDDGAAPEGGVVVGPNGVLYGTAEYGGAQSKGVVFQLTPPATPGGPWTETVLHSFGSAGEGIFPTSPLVLDDSGALYGGTAWGGSSMPANIFELTPPAAHGGQWTVTSLYAFPASATTTSISALVQREGNFYGIAVIGTKGAGEVFELTQPAVPGGAWTFTILHAFQSVTDGLQLNPQLLFDASGALYGSAQSGGGSDCNRDADGCGIVFQLVPPAVTGGAWTENILYNFSANNGRQGGGVGTVALYNGLLYGTACTNQLFDLTPPASGGVPWTESTLATFTSADGTCPEGLELNNGAFYGVATNSGILHGTIYQVAP